MADMFEQMMEEEVRKKAEATAAARKALELAEAEEAALVKKMLLAKSAKNDTKATGASASGLKATNVFQMPKGIVKDAPRDSKKQPQLTMTAKNNWRNLISQDWPGKNEWVEDVEDWFKVHAVNCFWFLNPNGLTKKTINLMVKFDGDTLWLVMQRCKGEGGKGLGNRKVSSMEVFDERLYSALRERHFHGWYEPNDYHDPI